MIITSVCVNEGMYRREFFFSRFTTLIHSKNNSCGKTTLLRLVLYGLGYSIPGVQDVDLDQFETKLKANHETLGEICLTRPSRHSIDLHSSSGTLNFILPSDQTGLHSILWNTNSPEVLRNILGTCYADQELGWQLLSSGLVVGKIRFNADDLVRGLSNVNCDALIAEKSKVESELKKYKLLYSVSKYKETVDQRSLISQSYTDQLDVELDETLAELRRLQVELNRVNTVLRDNKQFKKFISNIKLLIQTPEGARIPVTEANIVGFTDSVDILKAKKNMLSSQISLLKHRLTELQYSKSREHEQLSFLRSKSLLESFDDCLSCLPLDFVTIKHTIDDLKRRSKELKKQITRITNTGNVISGIILDHIKQYAAELNIQDQYILPALKGEKLNFSGAILHKISFAFRLAHVAALQQILKIKVPIILDSPSGKEVDVKNIELMLNLLTRYFKDNQIIIASIYLYDLKPREVITLNDRIIDMT